MQSKSVFFNIAILADFMWKNADINRTQGMCHVIYVFFGPSLVKV